MPKRDRAAYMREYRRRTTEPIPNHQHQFIDVRRYLDGEKTMGCLSCVHCGLQDGPLREVPRFGIPEPLRDDGHAMPTMLLMTQAERDAILRRVNRH